MKKVRCTEGHFYDADRFPECPICHVPISELPETELLPQEEVQSEDAVRTEVCMDTMLLASAEEPDLSQWGNVSQNEMGAAAAPLAQTMAYYHFNEYEPPVGWLISVKGPYRGKAFECKAGKNKIGRKSDMDICLANDASVTREAHAFLIYEPQQRRFYLMAGSGDGLVYQNGNLVFDHDELFAYDKVALGQSEFVFLPLCGERFAWDQYI